MEVPVVETRDLTKRYGSLAALEGLSLAIGRGEVFGLLGQNGAGKTTTLRLLLDLLHPTRGSALLFGRSALEAGARVRVGYLPGDLALDGRLRGTANLDLLGALRPAGARSVDPARRSRIADCLGLTASDLGRRVREYSRGMRQKLGLLAAFQHDPDLLILDEPTTGLDPLVRESALELLIQAGREGRTVLHSSHVLSEVERTCTRVGILRAGRLVALERMEDLRRAVVRRMVVRFGRDVDRACLSLPGVEIVQQDGRTFTLRVSGGLDALLAALALHPVEHLSFPEPSLEEAFVAHYGPRGEAS